MKKEQLTRIRSIDLLSYLLSQRPEELVYASKNVYRLKSHHSLVISNGFWYYFSGDFGGYSALDYLIQVENYSFIEAIRKLADFDTAQIRPVQDSRVKDSLFILPERSKHIYLIYLYLNGKRAIHQDVIRYCIENHLIYQENKGSDLIFVGYDENHIPRFACKRSTSSSYRGDVHNSQKKYSFHIENEDSHTLHVFESAIDLLSYLSLIHLENSRFIQDHYLSLSGLSEAPLKHYLRMHAIDTIIFHLDHDEAGQRATEKLMQTYQQHYQVIDQTIPDYKDVNEALQAIHHTIHHILG